jgi:hypothetical protein
MRILDKVLGHAIAIGVAVAPCLAGAQMVTGAPILPQPGTVMPPDSKMVRAYTIERGRPYSGVRVVQHVRSFRMDTARKRDPVPRSGAIAKDVLEKMSHGRMRSKGS